MDFFTIGDKINVSDYNSLVYLLRKFKRLNTGLTLGSTSLKSEYGSFVFDKPLTSIGTNFIIENEINISSSDCLRNCFYTFLFSVIDVNTSGTVNKRQVKVTGNTGENGELFITLPTDLIESDEVILPNFNVDIVFDEHEYYTPVSGLNVDLSVDKLYILTGETATVTATVTDETGEPVENLSLQFNINGTKYTKTTDSDGIAEHTYTGTGVGNVNITVSGQSILLYDGQPFILKYTGNTIVLGHGVNWLSTDGDVIIDWGDGSTTTVNNPYSSGLTHNYTDGEIEHTITFIGTVTKIRSLFYKDNGLTSVILPDTITGLISAFYECNNIVDYQLYWQNDAIIQYDKYNMPVNSNTVFTIPNGETNNYIAKGYPSDKLFERGYRIYITGDNIIETGETTTITAQLVDTKTPVSGETLSYVLKHGETIIDSGSDTTDTNGEIEIQYTGTGAGDIKLTTTYDNITNTYTIEDLLFYDKATTGHKNPNWTKTSESLTVTTTDEGTILSSTSVNSEYKTTALFDGDFKATITVYATGAAVRLGFKDEDNRYSRVVTNSTDRIIYYEFTRQDDVYSCKYSYDGEKWFNRNFELNNVIDDAYFIFLIIFPSGTSGTRTIRYSDLKIKALSTDVHDYSVSLVADKSAVTVGESVVLTGSLLDDGVPVSGVSVSLYDGATSLGTVSTDSDGEFIKTLTNLSVGSHSLKAVYSDVESSIVSVTVSKISTSTSITASSSSILTTDTLTLAGSVTNVSTGSVKIYEGSTLVDEVSLSSGSYSKSLTGLSVGTHTYKAVYDGDSTHDGSESSTVTVTVSEPAPVHDYSLSIASDKDILSYEDRESATITATLTDNSSPASGETLTYTIKHGATTITTGSDTTDANGEITITYPSTGIGDVDIIVDFGILLQETYELQDYYYYDSLTVDKQRYVTVSGSPVLTYSNDGLNINTSVTQVGLVKNNFLTLPNNYEAEITITYTRENNEGTGICFDDFLADRGTNIVSLWKLSNTSRLVNNLTKWKTGDTVKFVKNGTSMSYYLNGNLVNTVTVSDDNHLQQFRTYQNRSTTFKDLKVKAL